MLATIRFLAFTVFALCCVVITFVVLGFFPSLRTREPFGMRLDLVLSLWIGMPIASGLRHFLANRRAKRGPAL